LEFPPVVAMDRVIPIYPQTLLAGGIINSYSTQKMKGHISKTDKAVKSEIEFDIPRNSTQL
jgi:hypothetical protein